MPTPSWFVGDMLAGRGKDVDIGSPEGRGEEGGSSFSGAGGANISSSSSCRFEAGMEMRRFFAGWRSVDRAVRPLKREFPPPPPRIPVLGLLLEVRLFAREGLAAADAPLPPLVVAVDVGSNVVVVEDLGPIFIFMDVLEAPFAPKLQGPFIPRFGI